MAARRVGHRSSDAWKVALISTFLGVILGYLGAIGMSWWNNRKDMQHAMSWLGTESTANINWAKGVIKSIKENRGAGYSLVGAVVLHPLSTGSLDYLVLRFGPSDFQKITSFENHSKLLMEIRYLNQLMTSRAAYFITRQGQPHSMSTLDNFDKEIEDLARWTLDYLPSATSWR